MLQVKLFENSVFKNLERNINDFLKKQPKLINVEFTPIEGKDKFYKAILLYDHRPLIIKALFKKEQPMKKGMKPKKVKKVMEEFKEGSLHSGSKKGPVVKNPKQAIAIGLSEARKAGERVSPKKGAR
jgi:uncharacterized protein DUF6496/sporulation protein Cse60